MSADNWAFCPNCDKIAAAKIIKNACDLQHLYGKIPADEFTRRSNELASIKSVREESLREDYEIGIYSDGTFKVDYRASCRVCGFSFSFTEEKEVAQ